MEFDTHQKQVFKSIINQFDNQNIRYVILRGFENLPCHISGGDIDIFVHESHYNDMIKICNDHNFDRKLNVIQGLSNLIKLCVDMPAKVSKRFVMNPLDSILAVKKILIDGNNHKSLNSNFNSIMLRSAGITLHLINHLAYKSPMNGNYVRIDPKIENLALESADENKNHNFKHLSPPNEIVHLICRGVFDYRGDFPKYYVSRIQKLSSTLSNSEYKNLKSSLDLVFFAAGDLVYESIDSGNIDTLYSDLLKFSDY